jgi:hypothetical protein
MRALSLYTFVGLMALASASLAAESPFNGTWERAGSTPTNKQVLTFNVTADRETYTSDLTRPDGTRQVTHYTAGYDGKEYPSQTTITKPDGTSVTRQDTVIMKRTGHRSEERHWIQGGKLALILKRTVSADGKTLYSTGIAIDANGHEKAGPRGSYIRQP